VVPFGSDTDAESSSDERVIPVFVMPGLSLPATKKSTARGYGGSIPFNRFEHNTHRRRKVRRSCVRARHVSRLQRKWFARLGQAVHRNTDRIDRFGRSQGFLRFLCGKARNVHVRDNAGEAVGACCRRVIGQRRRCWAHDEPVMDEAVDAPESNRGALKPGSDSENTGKNAESIID